MRTRIIVRIVFLSLLAHGAQAAQWFSLASRDSRADETVVEVDLQSVRLRGDSGEAVIRVTYDVLQPHPAGYGYRSFIATVQVHCRQQAMAVESAAYFARPQGDGVRVGADSTGRQAGMPPRLLESLPPHQRQALLRAACATTGP
ncbi:MAG TPA: surface-adhesin E family protein [Candidatus Paceibacterota bacterium]|nr:surface-adhesin E family protein [Candidatus Paceibacterota bacterium]